MKGSITYEEPALANEMSQQAVKRDNVGQLMESFWVEFEAPFFKKGASRFCGNIY